MGVFDFLGGKKQKNEIQRLTEELEALKKEKLSVEQMTALELQEDILKKKNTLNEKDQEINEAENKLFKIGMEVTKQENKVKELKQELISINEDLNMESYGLYRPQYDFATSLGYKDRLDKLRKEQKDMIKNKKAAICSKEWTVEGSKAKGRKMTNDNIKQLLRSFNNECEAAINKVKYNNVEKIANRIRKSYEDLNKLNASYFISITRNYLSLKIDEVYLAYEYERKKQDEKEELREQREKEREEKALQKEIQSKKKVIDKDITHYKNIIEELSAKLENVLDDEKHELEKQILELQTKIQEKEEEKEELDYRNANASAGYVYIISNIGAFGPDVVKIGVTRRLDPLERIAELSSASVPFKFDIHALIFSYNAYQLETDLHNFFNKERINKVNNRKEFFKVPIDQIEDKLKEYKELTIDFNKEPDAEEYRESLQIS